MYIRAIYLKLSKVGSIFVYILTGISGCRLQCKMMLKTKLGMTIGYVRYASSSLIGLLLLINMGCAKEDSAEPTLDDYDMEVISYFQEIILGFEFGGASEVTRRWETPMKMFVGGRPTSEHKNELTQIIGEINALVTTDFVVEQVSDSLQSNYYVYFGSGTDYARLFPKQANLVSANYGLFRIYWNGAQELNRGHMYVDILRATAEEQLHLLREELTQSLGLPKDSERYRASIFQQSFSTKTTNYAQIDEDIIRLLYHPTMQTNLNDLQVREVLREILLSEK